MEFNYPKQKNGMYVLSKYDFDVIAESVLSVYSPQNLSYPAPLDTVKFLEDMGLLVKHKLIGMPGRDILGATIMGDSEEIPVYDYFEGQDVLEETRGTVLINSNLCCGKHAPRRRYTEVHEGSHWLLHNEYFERLERNDKTVKIACRVVESYKRDKATEHDWLEWQADSLAAALLMPKEVFYDYVRRLIKDAGVNRGYLYEGSYSDKRVFNDIIGKITNRFYVSRRAAQIRMIHLGLIKTA